MREGNYMKRNGKNLKKEEGKNKSIIEFSEYMIKNKSKGAKEKMKIINEKSAMKAKVENMQRINEINNMEDRLNGKKENYKMKENNKQKEKRGRVKKINLIYLIIIFFAIFSVIVYAYMTARASKVNDIALGYNKIEVLENYTPPIKMEAGISFTKEPYVKNTGDVNCYVRIKSVVSDSRVEKYLTIKYGETEGYNTTDFTYNDSDGYWYYNKILAPGEQTEKLFTSVTVAEDADENVLEGFDIYVYAESVQTIEGKTMAEVWETK